MRGKRTPAAGVMDRSKDQEAKTKGDMGNVVTEEAIPSCQWVGGCICSFFSAFVQGASHMAGLCVCVCFSMWCSCNLLHPLWAFFLLFPNRWQM